MSIYYGFKVGFGAEVLIDGREPCPITSRILGLGR